MFLSLCSHLLSVSPSNVISINLHRGVGRKRVTRKPMMSQGFEMGYWSIGWWMVKKKRSKSWNFKIRERRVVEKDGGWFAYIYIYVKFTT